MATPIPPNQAHFTLDEIAAATSGRARHGLLPQVTSVTTDTRAELAGSLFVALRGERFDGHDYVAEAVARGAAAVLISRSMAVPEAASVVEVPCTLQALLALARFHRQRWGGTVVAIGGSAGKTTTRVAVAAALRIGSPEAVHAAAGNLNNQVGLPMVLFGLGEQHTSAVVEIGTNQRGEVALLAGVAIPDMAVLTSIGVEHAEGIGDLDAIEQEEGDLFSSLGAGGAAFANSDDARCLRQLQRAPSSRRIGFGTAPEASYRIVRRIAGRHGGAELELSTPRGLVRLTTPLSGLAGAYASLAALAVAEHVKGAPLEPAALEQALRAAPFEAGRCTLIELPDGTVVLDDTYNSNPVSLRSSLQTAQELAAARSARLVLVLGEMRELGPLAAAEHGQLGSELFDFAPSELIGISGDARLFVSGASARGVSSVFAEGAAAAAKLALGCVRPGDVVLVKASRGVRAEQVVEALVSRDVAGLE